MNVTNTNKRNSIASVWAAAVVLSGCAAGPAAPPPAPPVAASTPQSQSAAAKSAAENPDEVICRTEVPSGSHRPVRDCRTRAAWEAARRASTGALDDLQRRTPTLPKGN